MLQWVKQNTLFHHCIFVKQNKQHAQIMQLYLLLYQVLPTYRKFLYNLTRKLIIHSPLCCEQCMEDSKPPDSRLCTTCVKDISDPEIDLAKMLEQKKCIHTNTYSLHTYLYLPILRKLPFTASMLWWRPYYLENWAMRFQGSSGDSKKIYVTNWWQYYSSTIWLICGCYN